MTVTSRKWPTSWDDLPLLLNVPESARVLGISRAGGYALARAEGFPATITIGRRVLISRDGLRAWIERQAEDSR